jgi:murein DD-endopeptidase MepM/ murein hydrolase activator NlpD
VLRGNLIPTPTRRVLTLALALVLLSATLGVKSARADSVSNDQAQIQSLQKRISAEGEHIQSLVARSNAAQARANDLNAQVTRQQQLVDADRAQEASTGLAVQQLAVNAYVRSGTIDTAALDLFNGSNSTMQALAHTTYAGIVGGKLSDAIAAFHLARSRAEDAQRTLRSEQSQVNDTLRQVNAARKKAEGAVEAEQATLSHAQADLLTALAAQRQAEEAAAERTLAAQHSPVATPTVVPPPIHPTPGSYANPVRAISGLTPERIDQGVDFSGFGPIYAIGDGVVLSTTNGGWPGGTFMAYRLTDGPAAGLVVYSAEDINPAVSVGATVNVNTVIGQVYEGPNGIELGWADPSGDGDTMARTYGEYHEGVSTAFGFNFSQLLQSLGAPGGVPQNSFQPLPISWPQW